MSHREKRSADQKQKVREAYGNIAQIGGSCCGPSSCCGSPTPDALSGKLGYSAEERAGIPSQADRGLACGNPFAVESIALGETVLDLGCGGGFDVFIAAKKAGREGRVIGVDMTPEMISQARKNAMTFGVETGLSNVEFRLGEIEHLPVADGTADIVISNCVINLSPDKPQVWQEIARVLKPGGRVTISDLALKQRLPEAIRESIEAYVGCIAGAVLIEDTERMIREAGLTIVSIEKHSEYIESMTEMQDPLYQQILEMLPEGSRISDYLTSASVVARKES